MTPPSRHKSLLGFVLSLFLIAPIFGQDGQIQHRAPNVVFIMADDLGFHEVGAFGQEKIRTPNLDRLASEGMMLTRHYSGSAVCAPTRSVLMTGLHTGHATIRGNKPVPGGNWHPESPEGQWPIPEEDFTLAELLSEKGYATGAFGKWGLGGPGSTGHPNHQGFDTFYGYLCQRIAHNYYPTHLWRNHDVDILDGNRFFSAHQRLESALGTQTEYDQRYRTQHYAPTEIATQMLGWVREHHEVSPERPFFLYYPTVIPHLALQAPESFIESYPESWDESHYLGQNGYLPTPRPRATYAAMISYMDHNVGLLLDLLDELDLADNTMVVFTSDNGASYVGGVDREFFNSLGDLRGRKGNLWEGGIRVPTIVRWPGRIAAGSASAFPSYHPDWLPTIAEVVGAAKSDSVLGTDKDADTSVVLTWAPSLDHLASIDGLSIAPTLLGRGGQAQREYMYWEFPEGPQQQAIIFGDQGQWKAIRPALKNDPGRIELFNLIQDPNERTNLGELRPREMGFARRVFTTARRPSELFPLPALDADFLNQD